MCAGVLGSHAHAEGLQRKYNGNESMSLALIPMLPQRQTRRCQHHPHLLPLLLRRLGTGRGRKERYWRRPPAPAPAAIRTTQQTEAWSRSGAKHQPFAAPIDNTSRNSAVLYVVWMGHLEPLGFGADHGAAIAKRLLPVVQSRMNRQRQLSSIEYLVTPAGESIKRHQTHHYVSLVSQWVCRLQAQIHERLQEGYVTAPCSCCWRGYE